ncbi:hypothetical protein KAFR_0C06100 [Kazachstania africana CBS 2517]|uniref:Uncharacterized protein n=1 Tax=Kazachstania africana (strain ATCC 22294 / BCRC 22015 / CBS 2517 / CECT 1963 / NBRC 1671 / NRRL Y-8276) TaxID=1071382 RepID=H2ATA1_KAZAF|nr:hypothetical protein KAFR_0C06100 [Kazachstania africana CBS 2517]CCF57601.1 hypothetical protein KAFR_0C06100 [Kazachstania africana CBS 2517]
MFVSPSPSNISMLGIQKRHGKKKSASEEHRPANRVDEKQEYHENDVHEHLRKEANFVNAPPEYADRARLEIKKRLLPNQKNLPNHSRNNNDISDAYSISTTVDSQSSFSSDAASSIFSQPSTIFSQTTNDSVPLTHSKFITQLSLEEALPKTFFDMYSPEVLMSDPSKVLYNGRPSFTKRELLDWDLNDVRSLLIVENLRPEWGHQLPEIINRTAPSLPKFRFQLLPLNSADTVIIQTLVNSDLYLEANIDYEFKLTSAKYTVAAARKRHEQIVGVHEPIMTLSKPEWRNIIENYLLNIAVEAQCRFDFKNHCNEFKKWKSEQHSLNLKKPDMPPPRMIPTTLNKNSSLLKKTLMKNLQLKNFQENKDSIAINTSNYNDGPSDNVYTTNHKITLTKEEKASIWSQCQTQVYQRLELDWKPDGV